MIRFVPSFSSGSSKRVGRWAVFGVARGLQIGHHGQSYGIVTIEKPGQRRSTPLEAIGAEIKQLCHFAAENPQLQSLVTRIGCSLAGYHDVEIKKLFQEVQSFEVISDNVVLPPSLECR